MKQSILFVCFFSFFLFTFAFSVFADNSPAQRGDSMVMHAKISVKNDYQLAYPGILPDNILYKLKLLRDKITAFLITDPGKKVNFYLLQIDKQIGMVKMLVDKKETGLAKTTALKAEDNFTQLIYVYRNSGTKPDANTYQKLKKAANKHQEVLTGVMQKVSPGDAKTFQQVINFSRTNVDSLNQIYSEKN